MNIKRIALFSVALIVALGLVACGSSNQALKTQTTAGSGKAVQAQKDGTATAGKSGDQKKDGSASGAGTQAKGSTASTTVVLKDIYFDFDKYLISSDSASVLKENAQWFGANPAARLRIEGNCDERGTVEYNLALGQKRADAAKNFLVTLGIDGKKIETISYGKEKPVDSASTAEAWAKNRRDHFVPTK